MRSRPYNGNGSRVDRSESRNVHLGPRVFFDGRGIGMGGNERGSARYNPLPEGWPGNGTTNEARAGRSEVHSQRRSRGVSENRVMLRGRSEEHTSELQSRLHLVCRLLLEKKK